MKSLSIIIVTYNSDELIFDCLNSIFKFNDINDNLEVIIVDNASRNVDKMFKLILNEYNNDIILIKNDTNSGYGSGNNIGVKYVNSPYFIVMNPDVKLVEPVFRKILSEFESQSNLALLGVKFKDGSNNIYIKPEKANLINMLFGKYLINRGIYNINQIFFSGSFMCFRKSTFLKVGMYDENIFLYHEEADIINRMLNVGAKIKLSKDIYVYHKMHGRELNLQLLKIGTISREYYFNKYSGNLNKYYRLLLLKYIIKYIHSVVLNDKSVIKENEAWIKLCYYRNANFIK